MAYKRDLRSPLAPTFGDDKPKKKKIKKKDRKVLTKATSSGKAADYKYTMPVPGSTKGDAVTVKKKKQTLTQSQRDRIAMKKQRLMSRQDRLIDKDIAGGMSKKKAEKEATKRVRDKVTNKKSGGKAKLTEKLEAKNYAKAYKEAVPASDRRAIRKYKRKKKVKSFKRKIGLGPKSAQTGRKNRKGRNDPNKGTARQNRIKTKQSCKNNRSASGCK